MSHRLLIAILLIMTYQPAGAQTSRQQEAHINRFIQDLFPVQTEGIDYEAVFDNLYQLYSQPLDLNTLTRDDLTATLLLSESQMTEFFRYRDLTGPFLSVYELQAIAGFDPATIRRLLPFVTLDTERGSLFRPLRNPTEHYVVFRTDRVLEEQKGFSPAEPDKNGNLPRRYLGNRQQWFLRYRYSRPRQFSLGLTAEQDPGEPFRWQPVQSQYGADYLSFHAQVQNRGRLRNLILGDFQLQIGQGLVMASGFFLGKGGETVAGVRRPMLGARPYTALTEYGFLRGITATYALTRRLDITIFAARNRRDANVVAPATSTGSATVSSLQTSGLHRTSSELEDRASLREQNLGVHLLYHAGQRLQLGAIVLHTGFDKGIQKRSQAYNQYEFSGKQNTLAGIHGTYLWRNVTFFGEAARSASGGAGLIGGAIASLTRRLDASLVFRHYDRNFHSFYANAFGENTRNINETGLYAGLRYIVYRKLTLGAYVDRFRFPWLRYLVDRPSDGWDYLGQATWTLTKQWTLSGVFRTEQKEKNLPGVKPTEVVRTHRRNYVLSAEYTPSRRLTLRTRAQWGSFRYDGRAASKGLALMEDATADFGRLSVSGRLAWFSTDNYDSRQYAYERDVLYAFSIPAYFYRGLRHYLLLQYQINRHLDVWLRWSQTRHANRETVGSDLDEIAGPHKSEVRLQARWRF